MSDSDAIITSDSIAMKVKDEEKQPLIPQTQSSPNKHPEDASQTITSGEEGDDEDDSNESDIFAFAVNSQSTRFSKMGPESSSLTTNCQSMMHLLKGNIGTGILAMPSAFNNAGLFMGTLALPLMGIICIHCMHMLLSCNRILCERFGCKHLDYEEVAEKAFLIGPKPLRRYSNIARKSVSTFLLITQFGFCCVYALFVCDNLRRIILGLSNNKISLDVRIYMLLVLPFAILLNFIKSLKHLSIASAIANLLQCTGLMIVFYNLIQDLPHTWERPAFVDIQKFPLYMGIAIYAFEGIGLVLPIQKEMKEPQAFAGPIGVLNTGMVIVACLYTAVGFFGYLKFGNNVMGSITLNLPAEPLYETCRFMFTIAIFLSYAIQFYVPITIIWPWVQSKFNLKDDMRKTRIIELSLRASLVIATFALAALIPKLELFISLVGAFSSSCLALIFPPIMEIAVLWDEEKSIGSWWWIFGKNAAIFLLGFLGFATGTYASLKEIVIEFTR